MVSVLLLAGLVLAPALIAPVARIRSAWLRVPLLLVLIPFHLFTRILHALETRPRALAGWLFWRTSVEVYVTLLVVGLPKR